MKKLFRILIIVFLIAFASLAYAFFNPVLVFSDQDTGVTVSVSRLKQDVNYLTSTPRPRNYQNLGSLDSAAAYIADEFRKAGLEVREQTFDVEGNSYKNIIGYYGPKDAARLVVGAHYDVCYDQPGADDNASGTAGLLELARLLAKHNPELPYGIELVAYTLEEPPFFRTENMGSFIHAESLYEANVKVKAMICLEMIGYFTDDKKSQEYPVSALKLFYPNKGNFITVVGKLRQGKLVRHMKSHMKEGANIPVESISAPKFVAGIDYSDHLNYWKFGYKAVMINNTAFYRNNNYHRPTDTRETLNYDKMAEVVKGVYWGIVNF